MSEKMEKLQVLVTKLSKAELTALHNMVVTRLKDLQDMEVRQNILSYHNGMRVEVYFDHVWWEGVIRKVNFKTVDVYVLAKDSVYRVWTGTNIRRKR